MSEREEEKQRGHYLRVEICRHKEGRLANETLTDSTKNQSIVQFGTIDEWIRFCSSFEVMLL